MRIALVLTPMDDAQLRLAAQVGVTDVVARYPGTWLEDLTALCERVASFGMRLSVIEGYLPHDRIVHGTEGRDQQIADIVQLLHNMGRAGVPICCYNFMPDDDWSRTRSDVPQRGGAKVTAFDAAELDAQGAAPGGAIDADSLWRNLEYLLRRIVPVAQSAGVKLALHPDDPPMSPLRGQDRIFTSPEDFDRLLELVPGEANGLCFCQGTFAEMGDLDIPATIRHFGSRIHYVHFRDVRGAVPAFEESFHDNGKTDMAEAIRAYRDIGYAGPMRPDHVPTLEGESNDTPGYHMLGRLHAVGYLRGLLDATARPASPDASE
jgi:mannonate dehydratase